MGRKPVKDPPKKLSEIIALANLIPPDPAPEAIKRLREIERLKELGRLKPAPSPEEFRLNLDISESGEVRFERLLMRTERLRVAWLRDLRRIEVLGRFARSAPGSRGLLEYRGPVIYTPETVSGLPDPGPEPAVIGGDQAPELKEWEANWHGLLEKTLNAENYGSWTRLLKAAPAVPYSAALAAGGPVTPFAKDEAVIESGGPKKSLHLPKIKELGNYLISAAAGILEPDPIYRTAWLNFRQIVVECLFRDARDLRALIERTARLDGAARFTFKREEWTTWRVLPGGTIAREVLPFRPALEMIAEEKWPIGRLRICPGCRLIFWQKRTDAETCGNGICSDTNQNQKRRPAKGNGRRRRKV